MKVAILSESSADEAAIRILVDAIHQAKTEPVPLFDPKSRGWPSVLKIVPAVIKYLHYRTDADALVVVVDSNGTSPHNPQDEQTCAGTGCRLCKLRSAAQHTRERLPPLAGRAGLRLAFGLAMPAIEAWWLCGVDQSFGEARWCRDLRAAPSRPPYAPRQLKARVYGTEQPALPKETEKMVEAAERLARDIDLLCRQYPIGFGALAAAVRSWTSGQPRG